jgi:hypothetical protein
MSSLVHRSSLPGSECPSLTCFLRALTCPSPRGLQDVSVPRSLAFLLRPHLSFDPRSPVGRSPPLALFFVSSLFCCSALQDVSASRSLAIFLYPHLSVALCHLGRECSSLAHFFSGPYLSTYLRSLVCECPFHARRPSVSSHVRQSALSSL